MKALKRIAIGLPIMLAAIAIVGAAIFFLGGWALVAVGVLAFSWAVGDAVVSHRAIRALRSGEREG